MHGPLALVATTPPAANTENCLCCSSSSASNQRNHSIENRFGAKSQEPQVQTLNRRWEDQFENKFGKKSFVKLNEFKCLVDELNNYIKFYIKLMILRMCMLIKICHLGTFSSWIF